jgi:L-cysteine:1D-myo-inositol 2-amino-2-deoxy-alpha-D-glucopyranoside ligase
MHLFNTLTRRLEPFLPVGDAVTIYVCGITPYDTTHLGHCFTYSTYDVLIRYLEFIGQSVTYVQNVTDIDDDVIKKAGELNENWWSLGNRWTVHFIEDNGALNIRPPDYFPRATDLIAEIVESVDSLIRVGVAYESGGSVYFHVDDDLDYGKLSRLTQEQMLPIANERGNFPDDPNKKDPLDFVLWQAQSPGEPAWKSPWGHGRPGWHIECSTMSAKYLGRPVDIHGGGADLVFPHHESEIAQAECATGEQPFTRYWMHVAMLRYQDEKMSKSLGNLVMVRDLLNAGWTADAIRLCMASRHYREEWNYEESVLIAASRLAEKFVVAVTATGGSGKMIDTKEAITSFQEAMENDLDTPRAISILKTLADAILEGTDSRYIDDAQVVLRDRCAILGLRLDKDGPEEAVVAGWKKHQKRFTD